MRKKTSRDRYDSGKGGFTLVEVLFALGILTFGGTSLIALFAHNLREARRAREEIVINVIQRDVMVRNQLAAFAAAASTPVKDFSRDIDTWLVKDIDTYDFMAEDATRQWNNIPAYRGYCFWVEPLERAGPAWSDDVNTHGLYLHDAQFVDWDGYGTIKVDEDGDGIPEKDVDFNNSAGVPDPEPSHQIHYDSRLMRDYTMRMRGIIAWDIKINIYNINIDGRPDPSMGVNITQTDAVKANIDTGGGDIAKYHVFYFSIYNTDTGKR